MRTASTKLVAALVAFGFSASATYAATFPATASPQTGQPAAPLSPIAKKGADDRRPEPRPDDVGCDDHGTDSCRATVAKKGADDRRPEPRPDDTGCDDDGTDICAVPAMQA